MTDLSLSMPIELDVADPASDIAPTPARLREVVLREHAFVWRSLRRLGVAEADVDDGVQKVFLVASRRMGDVAPQRERAFLFATAMRIAANERRGESRRRSAGPQALETMRAEGPSPEAVAHDRALLDRLLESLPLELRSVIVLFELEGLTAEEIAQVLEIPVGTVASRVRRAREQILATKARLDAARGGAS